MPAKKIPYVHKISGDVKIVTRQSAKRLSDDYEQVEFVKNNEGKQVMRLQLANAVVDISENELQPEAEDGIGSTK